MQLVINNLTSSAKSYNSGAVTVTANGSTTVTNTTYLLELCTDGGLRSDLFANNITLGDGTNTFGSTDAVTYLTLLGNLLGPVSDGSGNQLTSTLVGSKQSLDVNVTQSSPQSDKATSGTITAVNGAVTITTFGLTTLNVSLTGTWVATLVFEGQCGDGTWFMLQASNPAGGQNLNTATSNNIYTIGVGGFTQVRARATAYTSGTVLVTMNASVGSQQNLAVDANGNQQMVGSVAAGTADSGNGVKVSGVYNSTLPSYSSGQRADLQLDSAGRLILSPTIQGVVQSIPLDGSKSSYSAAIHGLATASSATDIFTITGSSTKTIRVTRVEVSFTASIYNIYDVLLIKRSSANSSGTSSAQTAVPHDSADAAATATVLAYTANPTLGTTVGTVRAGKLYGNEVSTPYGENIIAWDFGTRPSQAIVLRGTSQVLAVNLNSTTVSGGSFDISVEWTEE